jgi:hypothetical protein
LPLDAFVARLLRGRVRFEEERATRPLACAVLVTAPDACRRRGGRFGHVAGVTNLAAEAAARPRYRLAGDVPVVALRDLWEADRRQAWSAPRAPSGACAAASPSSHPSRRAAARSWARLT